MNNNSQSNKLEDLVFWYKAEMHGDFRIGAAEFWQLSMQQKRDQDGDDYDPNSARRLKGPSIQVRRIN
jgi:hypothetical protein